MNEGEGDEMRQTRKMRKIPFAVVGADFLGGK